MKSRRNLRSFTLVEMLIVIAIICVMAGMILKVMTYAKRQQEKAACVAMIERVAHALNEYRAEYGQYPPVVTSACPHLLNCHRKDCRTCYSFGRPSGETPPPLWENYFKTTPGDSGDMFKFGLVSYLIPRVTNSPSSPFYNTTAYRENMDSPRDVALKRKWASFLENLIDGRDNWGGAGVDTTNHFVAGLQYSVPVYSLTDPWGRSLRYRSDPPYLTYDLWSAGPDGYDGDGSAGAYSQERQMG